jgi:four helix bundle protein
MNKRKHPTTNNQHRTSNGRDVADQVESSAIWEFNERAPENRKFDLENRLLEFASAIVDLSEKLPTTRAANHVAGQVLRSGTSPLSNHGEAEDAESRQDFIHKLKVCLKELRETRRWARLIHHKRWAKQDSTLPFVLNETDELIRIFYSSIQTAKRNAPADSLARPKSVPYPGGGVG